MRQGQLLYGGSSNRARARVRRLHPRGRKKSTPSLAAASAWLRKSIVIFSFIDLNLLHAGVPVLCDLEQSYTGAFKDWPCPRLALGRSLSRASLHGFPMTTTREDLPALPRLALDNQD